MQMLKKHAGTIAKIASIIAFATPIMILYFLYPQTFEPVWTGTWKNRVYHLFFIWLLCLETILSWEELHTAKLRLKSVKAIVFIILLLLPTIYVIVANYYGLNDWIVSLSKQYGVESDWAELMPLSAEYLVFAVLCALLAFTHYGKKGMKDYSISTFFPALMGTIYTIDNVYPFGKFTPFQILVQPTAIIVANVLNMMGYQTSIIFIENHPVYGSMPLLMIGNSHAPPLGISWPCAGIESLIIYTLTILLFLKKTVISLKHKIIYFVIGAIVTYLINILRIVTIAVIAANGGDWGLIHDYYGQLYSITWIISYPLIIIGSRILWNKIKHQKPTSMDQPNLSIST